jgi:hypothetical protein
MKTKEREQEIKGMDEDVVFLQFYKVMINSKRSSLYVDLALRLTDRWLNGGAHLQAGEGDGNGGAAIDHSVFAEENQFSTSGCGYCGHGLPQYLR